ncbi:hypothetical protein FPQ18DRAFT_422309 [Pyronema domesticum]|nr:hypothetical protein FPQ18DRAFT_422309 [Pyronema domesticum]
MDWYHCKLEVMEKVKESGLEYTAFRNGQLINYWAHGSPHLKAVEEGLAGMGFAFVVDVGNETAEIPGTGDQKVTFTRTQDVGAFVAAAVGLEKWEEEMGMGGETTTYNKVVRKGVVEGEIEKEGSREDGGRKFYLQAMLAVAKGEGEIKMRLNELVPEIKLWGVDKFLGIWWGNEGSGEK